MAKNFEKMTSNLKGLFLSQNFIKYFAIGLEYSESLRQKANVANFSKAGKLRRQSDQILSMMYGQVCSIGRSSFIGKSAISVLECLRFQGSAVLNKHIGLNNVREELDHIITIHRQYVDGARKLCEKEHNSISSEVEYQRALATLGSTYLDIAELVLNRHSMVRKRMQRHAMSYLAQASDCSHRLHSENKISEIEWRNQTSRLHFNMGMCKEGTQSENEDLRCEPSWLEAIQYYKKAVEGVRQIPDNLECIIKFATGLIELLAWKYANKKEAIITVDQLIGNIKNSASTLKIQQLNEALLLKAKVYLSFNECSNSLTVLNKISQSRFMLDVKHWKEEAKKLQSLLKEKQYMEIAKFHEVNQFYHASQQILKKLSTPESQQNQIFCLIQLEQYSQALDIIEKLLSSEKFKNNKSMLVDKANCLVHILSVQFDTQNEAFKRAYSATSPAQDLEGELQFLLNWQDLSTENKIDFSMSGKLSELQDLYQEDSDEQEDSVSDEDDEEDHLKKKVVGINIKGETPLHQAVISGNLKRVKTLIAEGHSVICKDHTGFTPLHDAAVECLMDIAKLLIENKHPINPQNIEGWTPLHSACLNGHTCMVRLLIKAGANHHLPSKDGMTSYKVLKERFCNEMSSEDKADIKECLQMLKPHRTKHVVMHDDTEPNSQESIDGKTLYQSAMKKTRQSGLMNPINKRTSRERNRAPKTVMNMGDEFYEENFIQNDLDSNSPDEMDESGVHSVKRRRSRSQSPVIQSTLCSALSARGRGHTNLSLTPDMPVLSQVNMFELPDISPEKRLSVPSDKLGFFQQAVNWQPGDIRSNKSESAPNVTSDSMQNRSKSFSVTVNFGDVSLSVPCNPSSTVQQLVKQVEKQYSAGGRALPQIKLAFSNKAELSLLHTVQEQVSDGDILIGEIMGYCSSHLAQMLKSKGLKDELLIDQVESQNSSLSIRSAFALELVSPFFICMPKLQQLTFNGFNLSSERMEFLGKMMPNNVNYIKLISCKLQMIKSFVNNWNKQPAITHLNISDDPIGGLKNLDPLLRKFPRLCILAIQDCHCLQLTDASIKFLSDLQFLHLNGNILLGFETFMQNCVPPITEIDLSSTHLSGTQIASLAYLKDSLSSLSLADCSLSQTLQEQLHEIIQSGQLPYLQQLNLSNNKAIKNEDFCKLLKAMCNADSSPIVRLFMRNCNLASPIANIANCLLAKMNFFCPLMELSLDIANINESEQLDLKKHWVSKHKFKALVKLGPSMMFKAK